MTIRPGQTFPIAKAQVIIYDGQGQAHAWEISDGTANWDFTGVGQSGRSTAKVVLEGEFRRRTKGVPAPTQGEIE